jgi:ketosteroid isomerase-like protein
MNLFNRRRNQIAARNPVFLVLVGIAIVCTNGCSTPQKEPRVQNSSNPDLTNSIAALKGAYAAFNRGDIDAAVQALDANIEWTEPPEFPGGGTYHGREGAKRYLAQSRAAWAEVNSQPERFIPAGNRIVVFVHARVKPKGSNEWQETNLADVYTVNDGKIVQMRAFADRQEALRWAGVKDSSL